MRVRCAISNISFEISGFASLHLPANNGYVHPLFTLERKALYPLYTQHCKNQLSPKESLILFLAFIHSSEKIDWQHPCTLIAEDKNTKVLIENSIHQLLQALQQTDLIRHPSFKQPMFNVTAGNADFATVRNWIRALTENVAYFYNRTATDKEIDSLNKITNSLSALILGGTDPSKYSHIIARWADKAGNFPADKSEQWRKTIRSCFSSAKMFATPLAELKEIKDYCECNIEVGSIHFHSLMKVLKEGIHRHIDYLGGSSLALGYTLLPEVGLKNVPYSEQGGGSDREAEAKNQQAIRAITSNAPATAPAKGDYASPIDFLRAKLAYRVSTIAASKSQSVSTIETVPNNVYEPEPEPESEELESYGLDEIDLENYGMSVTDNPNSNNGEQ